MIRAKSYTQVYRRRLPHVQWDTRPLFVTFRSWSDLQLTPAARQAVLRTILHDNGTRYDLHAAVVMPDHVHMLFEPLTDDLGEAFTLREIMQRVKSASAHLANSAMRRRGPVWQEESFDHVLRRSEALGEKILYIQANPVAAGLVSSPREYPWLWVKE